MNEIREWSFEGASVRTVEINGEPRFIGKDVAERLGYSNPQKAIRDHVDSEDKTVNESFTVNGTPPILINESGVYALIFGSKLEAAKRFKRWVTSEVLPAIRKTGQYRQTDRKPDSYMIEDRVQRAQRWIEETQEWTDKVQAMQCTIDRNAPKVALADAIIADTGCILIGDLAKLLRQNGIETGQRRLFQWMREHEWLCSGTSQRNLPTQKAIALGYLVLQERVLHFDGEERRKFTPLVTGAGQHYFINWFLEHENPGAKPREIAAAKQAAKPKPNKYPPERRRLGDKIRRALDRQHMSQQDLADAVGVSRQVINHLVLGRNSTAATRIKQIADVLGTTIDDLLAE